MDLRQQIKEDRQYVLELRRHFHQHPELSMAEYKTAERIEAELAEQGIERRRIGATGVLGLIRGGLPGDKVIVLRADTDALPITEINNAPYRSLNPGVMHACGHDAHTACLLGAAKALQKNREYFGGEIRLFFQPGEEIGAGANPFMEQGLLEGVGRVFGIHVAPDLPVGIIGVKPGVNNASVDHFKVTVTGKAAHVSTPQLGIDALYIASQTVVGLQALVTRCTSPIDPVIIGVGILQAGTSYNIVAPSAVLEGTTRTTSQETRDHIRQQVTELVQQTAAIYGGSAQVEWTDFASPLINDAAVCGEVGAIVTSLWGKDSLITERALALSGDNFAEYIQEIPGAYAYVGTRNEKLPHTLLSVHNDGFDIDESALLFGAALYASYTFHWLNEEDFSK